MKKILILCGILLPLLFSCKNVRQSKEMFKSVDVEEFAKMISDGKVQRLDVRTMGEYEDGHLENAILIDVLEDTYETKALEALDKDRPVALYCRSGNRSKKAAEILSANGFEVYELSSGYKGWIASGMPVVR